ncbi:solute carrier family 49 member 4 homolog isoform X2 [Littorina saxatilis]|uniref:Uncharacterized protein n=1 Tax=Littorina saxatilis TaxID=31220 RepID=A0AAN9B7L5_9CAEN
MANNTDDSKPLLLPNSSNNDDCNGCDNHIHANNNYNSTNASQQQCVPFSKEYGPAWPTVQSPDDDDDKAGEQKDASRTNVDFKDETHVYKRRWYILIVFSLLAATQGGVWNTFGPIASTTQDALDWSTATTALLQNWGPITYILSALFFSWMVDVKGLRWACVVTALLVAVGAAVRCITMDPVAFTWLAHLGQILNGLGGLFGMAGAPMVSAAWFPPNERATATAFGIALNFMGVAITFVLGPLIVPDVPFNTSTSTNFTPFNLRPCQGLYASDEEWLNHTNCTGGLDNNTVAERISREKNAIRLYMFYTGGWCVALLVVVLVYFPRKPPRPPCASAAIKKEDFLKGLKHLMTRGQFWLVAAVYGVSLGALNGWSSVLDVILKPHGIGEKEAGWIGFYSICGACVVSLVVARFADYVSRVMKWLVLFCYLLSTTFFLLFALSAAGVIPASAALFYTTIIAGFTALNAAVPLMYELCNELAYPTGEGVINGVLGLVNNIFAVIFLFVMMIPGIGSMWTNWVLAGASAVCLPLLLLMKEQYNRLEIDEHNPRLSIEVVIPAPQPSDTRSL